MPVGNECDLERIFSNAEQEDGVELLYKVFGFAGYNLR